VAILISMSNMNNMYEGIGADDTQTAPYHAPGGPSGSGPGGSGPGGGGPGGGGPGGGGPGGGGPGGGGPGGGSGNGPGRGAWSRGKWVAATLAVCTVAGAGAFAIVGATTGSPAAAQTAITQAASTQAGTSANVTEQVSVLRGALAATGIRRLERLRRLGGIYGQYTYETKSGPRTLAFERGTITSVANGDVVVRAADGTTWVWVLTGTSVVRENGVKEPESALAPGETVFAGGPVTSGARDARLIVIRKAATTPKTSGTA
jgi:hypothetical protein